MWGRIFGKRRSDFSGCQGLGKEAIGYRTGELNGYYSYECIYLSHVAITSHHGYNIVPVGNRQEARGRESIQISVPLPDNCAELPELPFFRYYSFPQFQWISLPSNLFLGCPWGCSTLFNLSSPFSPSQAPAILSLLLLLPLYERCTLSTLPGVFFSLFLVTYFPIQHVCFRLAQEPSPPALVSEQAGQGRGSH
jgi:hypothetical protein